MELRDLYVSPESKLTKANFSIVEGKMLRVENRVILPCACTSCGATNEEKMKVQNDHFYYSGSYLYLWILLTPLALIIAYYAFRNRFDLSYWRCEECLARNSKWRKYFLFSSGLLAISIASIFLFPEWLAGSLFVTAAIAFFIAMFGFAKNSSQIALKGRTGNFYFLSGFHKDFINFISSKL